MAGYQPARGAARGETIQEFMARRGREVASFGRAAEAAAYAGVKKAIRAGQDYRLMTPGEVMAYGASLVRQPKPATKPVAAREPVPAKSRGLDDSAAAKAVAGTVAYVAGLAPGAVRGAWHTVKGAAEAAEFVQRLGSPLDILLSPPGQSAPDQLANFGGSVADYALQRVQNPSKVREDIASALNELRIKHDPTATPVADTLAGEMKRAF